MQKMKTAFYLFVFPIGLIFLSCVSRYPSLGLLENYALLREGACFRQEYVDPTAHFSKYKRIRVKPVNLEFFDKTAKFKLGFGEVERLGSLLEIELKNHLSKKYRVLGPNEKPDSQTLIVEPALLYARTPSCLLNILTIIPLTSASAAFEVKLSNSSTEKMVAQVAEERKGPSDFSSVFPGPYTRHAELKAIFKKWSKNLAVFLENCTQTNE